MARKTQVILIDDIDGTEIAEGGGETISFAYRGVQYQIDLNAKNAAKMDKALEAYISNAERVGGRRQSTGTSPGRSSELAKVRAWANEQGLKVSARGRIAQDVMDAYNAAH